MSDINFKSSGNIASSVAFARSELRSWPFGLLYAGSIIALSSMPIVLILGYYYRSISFVVISIYFIAAALSIYFLAYKTFISRALGRFVSISARTGLDRILAREEQNVYLCLAPELADLLLHAEFERGGLGAKKILDKISNSKGVSFCLHRLGVGRSAFIRFNPKVTLDDNVWLDALQIAVSHNHKGVTATDLLVSLVKNDTQLANEFGHFGISESDINDVARWFNRNNDEDKPIDTLERHIARCERHFHSYVTYSTLKSIAKISGNDEKKAIKLLYAVCAFAKKERDETVVLPKDVEEYILKKKR